MMENNVTLKDNKWLWPIIDENSWEGQNKSIDLHKTVLKHVKKNNVMVQAGGNCGFILNTFVKHFDTIYTFEPDPVNFYCLSHNVTNSNVFKMQACLGNTKETVKTQQLITEGRPHDIGGVHINGKGFTPTLIIDNFNLPACDLIQLDIEGYELKALKGAVETIKKFKPVLCIEFCEKWLNRYQTSNSEIEKFLIDLNYEQTDEHFVDKIFTYKN